MAGFVFKYRCYNYVDKAPVIDRMRTVLQKEGYYSKKRRRVLHELSGVSTATFEGWFEGETRSPRSETIYATMAAIGYKEEFVKARTIDEEKELQTAREFLEQQRGLRERAGSSRAKKKMNGHSKRGSK